MYLYSNVFADSGSDSESDSSDPDVDDGGGFDAEDLVDFPRARSIELGFRRDRVKSKISSRCLVSGATGYHQS